METTNEATYNFGKEEYTKKNLTPTDILDLAFAYAQAPVNKIIGNKLDYRIKSANDLSRLLGSTQMDPKAKSGKPALILHLLKNSLVTKDEYIKLYKELIGKHNSVVKALKNASPERRNAGGAARAAAKDMKGEFHESVNEASNDYSPLAYAKLVAKGKISMEKAIKDTGYPFIILAKLVKAYDRNYKFEGVMNEGHFGEIDIMAQEASNFREFVKDFYKEYKDFPKDRDTMKWLESLYKSRANEGLDSQGMERVADGLPQTEEEPKSENIRLKNLMK